MLKKKKVTYNPPEQNCLPQWQFQGISGAAFLHTAEIPEYKISTVKSHLSFLILLEILKKVLALFLF